MKKQLRRQDGWAVGTALEKLVIQTDCRQLFMFSAITWNRHAIHYDRQSARAEGLPGVVVQRALIGNFFARLLEQGTHQRADIQRLEWKVMRSAVPGDTLTCSGVVRRTHAERGTALIDCDLQMVNQEGDTVAKGAATLKLASR